MPAERASAGAMGGNVCALPPDADSIARLLHRFGAVNGPPYRNFVERRRLLEASITVAKQEVKRLHGVLADLERRRLSMPAQALPAESVCLVAGLTELLRNTLLASEGNLSVLQAQLASIKC